MREHGKTQEETVMTPEMAICTALMRMLQDRDGSMECAGTYTVEVVAALGISDALVLRVYVERVGQKVGGDVRLNP